jgi:hypothetical protein
VHRLRPKGTSPLGQPAFGYVSPLAADGYPELEATAEASIGLESPEAIPGVSKTDGVTTIVYVEKQLRGAPGSPVLTAAQTCPSTPRCALTNHVIGKPRKANNDVITIRVATTADDITFEDVGAASGLQTRSARSPYSAIVGLQRTTNRFAAQYIIEFRP